MLMTGHCKSKNCVEMYRYYMIHGVSPFERMLNEAGGSLALAVIKCVASLIFQKACHWLQLCHVLSMH